MGDEERLRARAELDERYALSWHDDLTPEVRSRFGIRQNIEDRTGAQ
jgi:hypothetical protein